MKDAKHHNPQVQVLLDKARAAMVNNWETMRVVRRTIDWTPDGDLVISTWRKDDASGLTVKIVEEIRG